MAKVRYPNLRRFMLGVTENLNFLEAEKVFYALTGKTFTRHDVSLKRSLLKKGGKAA